jgi:general secretion pathway protein I
VRNSPAAREGGFTLLEMIVATLIMAIAVTGLLSGISGATRNAARVREYDHVAQLAREQMNRLLTDYTLPASGTAGSNFDPALTGGMEAGWSARTSVAAPPPNDMPGELYLQRIELNIWWMSGGNRRSVMLEGFRRNKLEAKAATP